MGDECVREILPNVKDFKKFWKDQGPYRYALTSAEFPPVLLEPEEWIFGNDLTGVLKDLMGFSRNKMGFIQAPFNPRKQAVLRPEGLSQWKIANFPESWNIMVSDLFVPEGHLTVRVVEKLSDLGLEEDAQGISTAFFTLLAEEMEEMGYALFLPRGDAKSASMAAYLEEWEADEGDAGLL